MGQGKLNLRILYVFDKYPSLYQNYIHLFVESIKNKIDVKILTFNDKSYIPDYNIKNDLYSRILKYFTQFFSTHKRRKDFLIFSKFDIIHIQHSFLFRKLIGYNKKQDQKIIITLRGGDTYIKPWLSGEWRTFYKNHHMIDVFVVMSHNQKNYLTKWGVPVEKIYVIPISFGKKSTAKAKFPNENVLKIVSAFRMTWEKNIEGNLYFIKLLVDKGIKVQYDIYGDGNDLGQVYYFTDRYNLNEYVNIFGKVENNILKATLRNYDFLLQLSYSDAMPTTIIEAQSYGVPCIVSNSDGILDGMKNNQTGFSDNFRNLENLAVKAINLWKNENEYYKYSEAAIVFVNDNFSIENEIEKITKLYNEI